MHSEEPRSASQQVERQETGIQDIPNATVASAIAGALVDAGVRRVYGVPGEDHMRLLDEIDRHGLTYVAARDEGAAAIMASAEASLTGIPGVLLVTPAPGLTNAINGIAAAFLDLVPLLILVGQHRSDRRSIVVRQNLDNHALAAAVTKLTLTMSDRVHQLMIKALDTCRASPSGPVLVEIPEDVAEMKAADKAATWRMPRGADTSLASPAAVAAVRQILVTSRRPVFIVGARSPHTAGPAIERAAAMLHAPIFTTPTAKGIVARTSPWNAGTFINGNLERAIVQDADQLVGFGLSAVDIFNSGWKYDIPIASIDLHTDKIESFFPIDYRIAGDPAALLDSAVTGEIVPSAWQEDAITRYRSDVFDRFVGHDDSLTIPSAIVDTQAIVPNQSIVTIDAGFGKPLASILWEPGEPRSYFSSHGLSTMGYAIPAANAIACAQPKRPVIAFLGDGSLLMRASEIGVAAQQGTGPIYVVWLDGSLSQIELKQQKSHLRAIGVRFEYPNCVKIGAAFGVNGVEVDTRVSYRAAIEEALASSSPTVIGAKVDQSRQGEWFDLLRG